jgi:peptidoglycan/xylan/chitin deacetylase (PgdA/CDA1 family)
MRSSRFSLLLSALAMCAAGAAADRRVAITIDDLPFAQSGPSTCQYAPLLARTRQLLQPLARHSVPVTGFVIGEGCAELTREQKRAVLKLWRDSGATLGNHTATHRSLNNIPLAEYEQDILHAGEQLQALAAGPARWFRSPYLATGKTAEARSGLERFLSRHGYRQAPVTIDNSDWLFANVYADALDRRDLALARRVRAEYVPYLESVTAFFEGQATRFLGREIPQILLLHANRLNADALGDVLQMFRRRGYRFISLDEAMADAAYSSADAYAGARGISWLRRWAMTKGLADQAEPVEPQWLREAFGAMRSR